MAEEPTVQDALRTAVSAIGGEDREGQQAMAESVAAALRGEGHAFVQAGTGTGKSVGYLVPAALHATSADGGPVIVATATLALQRQLVDRDLPRVAAAAVRSWRRSATAVRRSRCSPCMTAALISPPHSRSCTTYTIRQLSWARHAGC